MKKQKTAIGLDIGSQSIKMVRINIVNDSSLEISDYKIREIHPGENKADAIKDVLKDVDLLRGDIPITVSVEGANIFIRVFKLPGVGKSKMDKIVEYEAQQQVPFQIKDVIWSYQCLRRVSPEETDVLLTAVKSNVVNELLGALKTDKIDIVPPVIGLNNLLSWNRYEDLRGASVEAVMVLDIGAKTTNVIITEKESLWFRTIPAGAEIITQALSNEFGISISNAELLKQEKGVILLEADERADTEAKRISTCIIKSITRITGEISRSIEVYSSSFNSLGPRKIFITGGGVRLKNIADFFNKKFRLDTEIMRNLKNVKISGVIDKTKWNEDCPILYTAIGLALHGAGFRKLNLTLLPKEIIKKQMWKKMQKYFFAIAGMFIFFGVCFSGYNMQMAGIYRANINKLRSEIKAVDTNKMQLIKIQKDLGIVKDTLDKINELRESRDFWLSMLLDLEGILPANLWLNKIETVMPKEKKMNYSAIKSKIIDLKIYGKTTGTYEDIKIFNDLLNNSVYFVKNTARVSSANPPLNGIRDFIIEAKADIVIEDE